MKVPLLVSLVLLELLVVSGRPEGDVSTATDSTLENTEVEKTSLSNEGRTSPEVSVKARSSYDPWALIRERYPDFDSNKPGDEYFKCWLLNNNATIRCIFKDEDPEDSDFYDIEEDTRQLYELFLQSGEPPALVTKATTPYNFLQGGKIEPSHVTPPTSGLKNESSSEETSFSSTSESTTSERTTTTSERTTTTSERTTTTSESTTQITTSEGTTKTEEVSKGADSGKQASGDLGNTEEGNGYPSARSWTDRVDSKECCCSNELKDLRTKDVMVTPPVYRNYSTYRNESSAASPFDVNGENVHVIPFSVQISICRPIACPRSNLVPVCHQRHKQVELSVLSLEKSTMFRENIYVEDGCSCVLRGTEEVIEKEKEENCDDEKLKLGWINTGINSIKSIAEKLLDLLKFNKLTAAVADHFTNSSKVFDDTIDSLEQLGPLKRKDGITGDESLQPSQPLELKDSDVATPVIPVIDDNNRPKFTSHVVDGVTTLVLPTKAEELITTSEPDNSTPIIRTNIVDEVTTLITMNPQSSQSVEVSSTPASDNLKSTVTNIVDGITTLTIISSPNTIEDLKDDQKSSVVKTNVITNIVNGVTTFTSDSLPAPAASTSVSTKIDPSFPNQDSTNFKTITFIIDGKTTFSIVPASTISSDVTTTTPVGQTTSDIPSAKPATSSDDSEPSSVLTQTVDGTVFLYKIFSTSEPSFSTNPLVAQDKSTDSFTNPTTILTSIPTPLNQSGTTQIVNGVTRVIFGPSASKFTSGNSKTVTITIDSTEENSPSATPSLVTTTQINDGKTTIFISGPSPSSDSVNSPSATASVVTTTQINDGKTTLISGPSPSSDSVNSPSATASVVTTTQINDGKTTLISGPSPSSVSESSTLSSPSLLTTTFIIDDETTLIVRPAVLPTRVVPEEVRTTHGDGNSKVSLPDKHDLNSAKYCNTNMTEFLGGSPLSDEKMGTILCGMEQEIKELLNTEPMQTFHTCLNSTFLTAIMAKIKSKPHDFDGVKFLEMAQELFSVHYESLAKKNSADLRFPGETVWRHFASSYILDDIDDNVMSLCRLQLDTFHENSILANLFSDLPDTSPLLNTVVKISYCANLLSDCKALAGEKLVRRLAAAHLIGKRAEEHNADVSSILEAKVLLVQEAKEALEWSKQTISAIDYSDPTIALLISYREMLLPYVKLYTNHCNAEKKSVPFGLVSPALTPSFNPFVPGGTVKATPTIDSQYSASITTMRDGQPIKMNHDYLYKLVSGSGK